MSARRVELVELASTVVSLEFCWIFEKFQFDQKFHPVPIAGFLAA
jgi:hypothetical protein